MSAFGRLCVYLGCAFLSASIAQAASFVRDVAPIFAAKCVTCHNREKLKGGYDMETFASLLRPGDSEEPSVVPHHPEKSHLFALLTTKDEDDRMPQKSEPLPPGQVALIKEWIAEGALIDDAIQTNVPLHTLIATAHPKPPESYLRPVPIRSVAFNVDGTELAVGGYHELTFWDVNKGTLLRRIAGVAQQVYGLAYSPDGRWLAVASGTPGKLGQLNLIDSSGAKPARLLGTSRDAMLVACFSPAGDRVAAAGADNSIRVYNAETGKQELLIEQHADWVLGLSFNRDGGLLASASRDKTARIFNTTNGELESTYVTHNDALFAIAFAKEENRVLSAGRDKTLHLWDGREAKKLEEAKGFEEEILRLAIGSNSVFTCSADRKVRQHSVGKKLELIRTFEGHNDIVYALAVHEPSGRMASGSYDGDVRIWAIDTGKAVLSFTAAPGLKAVRSAKAN